MKSATTADNLKEMESGGENSCRSSDGIKDPSWIGQFRNGSNPWMARYVYGFIFLSANLLAWAARDYGHGLLTEMRSKILVQLVISSCIDRIADCFV